MQRNPRYDILFEPVRIGPVVAPNRFYQTPHATGMGWREPQSSAALRGVKAEGGWGVVCTEYCSIHPSSDDFPHGFVSLWDEDDVRALALTADAIHAHGSLAAVELWHGGYARQQPDDREPPLSGLRRGRANSIQPVTARAMDKAGYRAISGAGSARRRCGPSAPALTSSMSMPAMIICRFSSCRGAATTGPTNMAERWKTARGCSAR